MKAIGFEQPFKLSDGNLFKTFNLDIPEPKVHEILVKIQSISVNPVDTKPINGCIKSTSSTRI